MPVSACEANFAEEQKVLSMNDQKRVSEPLNMTIPPAGMSRRTFIQLASAAGILTSAGLYGCGNSPRSVSGKIVIVGGGAAGLSMAALLKRWIDDPDITLIDPSARQFYQPGFTLIASGVYKPEDVWKSQEDCIPEGINWVRDEVVAIDPVHNMMVSRKNGRIGYDFLVLTPGLQINWNAVEGITRETLGEGNAHSIYDFEGAIRTWPAMSRFAEKGGKGIFTDTYTKHKCGGAPKKICLLTDDLSRKKNSREKLSLQFYTASKALYDIPYFTPRLEEIYKERDIPVSTKVRVKGIDTLTRKAYLDRYETVEGETVITSFTEDYDFLHFTPPMSAPDFVREAGLSWAEGSMAAEGWVMVDKETLVHSVYRNIVCLGDCAGIPTSKTSAAIRKQVPVAAKNLISLMEGKEPEEKYNGYAACPIITGYGKVLLCEFDYEKQPKITFPFSMLDMSKEQAAAWFMKVYLLKPVYFYGMLNGYLL